EAVGTDHERTRPGRRGGTLVRDGGAAPRGGLGGLGGGGRRGGRPRTDRDRLGLPDVVGHGTLLLFLFLVLLFLLGVALRVARVAGPRRGVVDVGGVEAAGVSVAGVGVDLAVPVDEHVRVVVGDDLVVADHAHGVVLETADGRRAVAVRTRQ